MKENVKALALALIGIAILTTGICINAGVEVITFGALISGTALGFLISDWYSKKNK